LGKIKQRSSIQQFKNCDAKLFNTDP